MGRGGRITWREGEREGDVDTRSLTRSTPKRTPTLQQSIIKHRRQAEAHEVPRSQCELACETANIRSQRSINVVDLTSHFARLNVSILISMKSCDGGNDSPI